MIVDVKGLTKRFHRSRRETFTAVDHIDFSIAPGERVAFIGPNGAGKSTTLKMLTGLLYPSSGSARVAGFVPWTERRRLAYEIGIVFGQRSQLWYHLRVRDSFELLAKIYGIDARLYRARAAHVAEVLRIGDLLEAPVKSLSLGQRMRCEIAAALLHRPKILFLDEPTIGLDVTAKALLREHLKHLAESEDTVILLTSHDTGDIEQICARVVLVNHGRILLDKPLETLRSSFLREKRITLVTEEEEPEAFPGATVVERGRHRLTLAVDAAEHSVGKIVAAALGRLAVRDLTIENAPLEAIIRDLYGERS
jgi:ABC-2 type transport system ATP-binding protein